MRCIYLINLETKENYFKISIVRIATWMLVNDSPSPANTYTLLKFTLWFSFSIRRKHGRVLTHPSTLQFYFVN